MRITHLAVFSILLGFAFGCARDDPASTNANKGKEDPLLAPKEIEPMGRNTKSQAIKAAEAHLRTKGSLSGSYDVDASVNEDGEWNVFFKFLPRTPGRHTSVIIDKNGSVLRVEPGA